LALAPVTGHNRPVMRDVAIAAIAAVADSVVLHYDGDFDHITDVEPAVRSRWVVPRGSTD